MTNSFNPNIYLPENVFSDILINCGIEGLLVYVETENIKRLSCIGKIKFSYTNFELLNNNGIINRAGNSTG